MGHFRWPWQTRHDPVIAMLDKLISDLKQEKELHRLSMNSIGRQLVKMEAKKLAEGGKG